MNLDLKMMYSMPMYVSMYLANQINRFSEGGGGEKLPNKYTSFIFHSKNASQQLGGLVSTMFYYFHPNPGGFMIQFDQMSL